MYNNLTINYIDPLIILTLSTAYPNDSDLGREIRKYLQSCDDATGQDELFFKKTKMRQLVNDPSQLNQKIKKIQEQEYE